MRFLSSIFGKHNGGQHVTPVEQILETPLKVVGSKAEKAQINALINRVAQAEAGKAVLEKAAQLGYTVAMDNLDGYGSCNGSDKRILLDAFSSDNKLVSTLAHEARHAEQIAAGAIDGYDPTKTIRSALMEKRLMEADAVAYSLLVCEQLYKQGDNMPHVSALENYFEPMRGFSDGLREAPTGNPESDALTGAVIGWFMKESLKISYEKSHIAKPLSFGLNLKTDPATLQEIELKESLAKICTRNGRPYFAADPEIFKRPVFCGISTSTKKWVDAYAKKCRSIGGKPEPSVEKIPVYLERPGNKVSLADYPEPLISMAVDKIKSQKLKEDFNKMKAKVSAFLGGR